MRTESGRRRSASPSRKTRQKASHTYGFWSVFPPKEPSPPRAIFHATCGPVHASFTTPVRSSTTACTTCPARPDHAFTTHSRRSGRNVADVVGPGG